VLSRILGHKGKEVIEGKRKLHYEELHNCILNYVLWADQFKEDTVVREYVTHWRCEK
jgi:hypothetical protein